MILKTGSISKHNTKNEEKTLKFGKENIRRSKKRLSFDNGGDYSVYLLILICNTNLVLQPTGTDLVNR